MRAKRVSQHWRHRHHCDQHALQNSRYYHAQNVMEQKWGQHSCSAHRSPQSTPPHPPARLHCQRESSVVSHTTLTMNWPHGRAVGQTQRRMMRVWGQQAAQSSRVYKQQVRGRSSPQKIPQGCSAASKMTHTRSLTRDVDESLC